VRLEESPEGYSTSDTISLNPGNHTIQLPYKFINLGLGWHSFSVQVNQDTEGPIAYQPTSYLGIWDVSYETQVINNIREIYWDAAIIKADGSYCFAPEWRDYGWGQIKGYWGIRCGDYDDATISGDVKLPSAYDGSNFGFEINMVNENLAYGDVVFHCAALCTDDGTWLSDPVAAVYGVEQPVTVEVGAREYNASGSGVVTGTGCATAVDPHLWWTCGLDANNTTLAMFASYVNGVKVDWNSANTPQPTWTITPTFTATPTRTPTNTP